MNSRKPFDSKIADLLAKQKKTMTIDTKEVSIVKQQASKALTAATDLQITNQEELNAADEVLKKIKTVGKLIKEQKEAITKPLNESLRNIRDLFKPIEQSHDEAESLVKRKILDYNDAEEAKRKKEADKIAAKVESGRMRPDTALTKMAAITEAPKTAHTVRIVRKYRITNELLIPRQYLTVDLTAIRKAVITDGIVVPGVEVYEEKELAGKSY